eukprot:scaffold52385_cov34-Tisochrysis_lutea.AAC.7
MFPENSREIPNFEQWAALRAAAGARWAERSACAYRYAAIINGRQWARTLRTCAVCRLVW